MDLRYGKHRLETVGKLQVLSTLVSRVWRIDNQTKVSSFKILKLRDILINLISDIKSNKVITNLYSKRYLFY